ncbi:50S ribosomal protein L22 [Patescibacteria group bacterium]|nr:50S ribosomal protein L22 [Patescibacteria group bacterium]
MEFKAKLRHLKISSRKVRLVIDSIRGNSVIEARGKLPFLGKRAAEPILKLLESAIANTKNNYEHLGIDVKEDNLYIKEITANDGPTLKRWKPRAFGRATPILKRTSHINLILAERKPSKVKKTKQAKPEIKIVKDLKEPIKEKIKEDKDIKESKPQELADDKKAKGRFNRLTNFIRKTGTK